ncbi:hypothetical protein Tco_0296272, partial [Tanacetum coccineum]
LSVAPTTISFLKAPNDKVPVLQVQHQVPIQFETPLVESEEDPTSLQEILRENIKQWVHPQVASPSTCLPPSSCDLSFSGGGDDEGSAAANSVMHVSADGDCGVQQKGRPELGAPSPPRPPHPSQHHHHVVIIR